MEKFYLLHRTGGVYEIVRGTSTSIATELDRRNANDPCGSTEVQAIFDTLEAAAEEVFRLTECL